MIALAESVSHGCNTLRYITGETPNKKHPERVYHIYNNLMPDSLDARGMWDSFKITLANNGKAKGRMKNTVMSFVLSPQPDQVRNFSDEDWKKLGLEFLAIFDELTLRDENGNVYSEPTNILGSKFTMWRHDDSKSGVQHLHIASLRIDMDGNTNNDHQILVRAQRAAEIQDRRRGWMTAMEVREDHLIDMEYHCDNILRNMQTFSIDAYFNALRNLPEGYTIEAKPDSNGDYVRYVICDGNKRYPASSIGKGRKYTVTHLEETWKRLRAAELARLQALKQAEETRIADRMQAQQKQSESKQNAAVQKPCTKSAEPLQQQCRHSAPQVQSPCTTSVKHHDYTKRQPGTTSYDYTERGKTTRLYIPQKVMYFFEAEFDYQTIANWDDLTHLAVGVFAGLVVPQSSQASIGTGGGGTSSDLPWRDKDEDDMAWARRCAQYATSKIGKTMKGGLSR